MIITMHLNRDEEDLRNFGYESDKRRNLHELCEKIFCIPATTAPVERVFSTSGLSMQPHSARVGYKLLSELVMIKNNVKPQPV